jgi:hypothetical protein
MSKAPRDKDSATPKKRTRKAAATSGNGNHAANGNGNDAVETSVIMAPESVSEKQLSPSSIEEQIRERAYELYLQRGGHGGSPEQDWLRAKEEICGRQNVA